VYVCKSWVVPSQWLCECRILVAAHAQRRCYRSVYMSKDSVVFLQCIWLQCMYIDLIKRKIDRFTASCRRVDVQKLSRAFAVYVYMSYMSCSMYAAVILCICKLQRADNYVVIASLFDCVWAQHMSKALLLLCRCWWDCSALLTSIACRRFVVSILYR